MTPTRLSAWHRPNRGNSSGTQPKTTHVNAACDGWTCRDGIRRESVLRVPFEGFSELTV